jgi:hypothetical protein
VLIVRATKKLLDRIGPPTLRDGEQSTTVLGQWYATALPWRPQVALLVNEPTLLPVLSPWPWPPPCRPGPPGISLRS